MNAWAWASGIVGGVFLIPSAVAWGAIAVDWERLRAIRQLRREVNAYSRLDRDSRAEHDRKQWRDAR